VANRVFNIAAGLDGNFGALVDGVDQAVANRTDGWTVAKIAAGNSAEFAAGTKQLSTTFTSQTTTPKPASFVTGSGANAFKTPAALTESYDSSTGGQWSCTLVFRATVASSQQGRVRVRVFKSASALGTSATELTTSTLTPSSGSLVNTTTDQGGAIFWNPGLITLNNEFLFFVVAWEITTASGSNTADVQFRTGQGTSAFTGAYFKSPTIIPAAAAPIPDVGMALTVT
jgi:hypothetical protein